MISDKRFDARPVQRKRLTRRKAGGRLLRSIHQNGSVNVVEGFLPGLYGETLAELQEGYQSFPIASDLSGSVTPEILPIKYCPYRTYDARFL